MMALSSSSTRARRRSAFLLPLLVALFTLLAGAGGATAAERPAAPPEERAAAVVRPAVIYLEQFWSGYVIDHDGDVLNDGEPFEFSTRCTGFAVNPAGYIVTAGHCVNPEMNRETFIELGAKYWVEQGWATPQQFDQLVSIGMANWKVEGLAKDSPVDLAVFAQRGVATSGLQSGQAMRARVLSSSNLDSGDVALVKVEQANMPSVLLAPSSEIEIGTPVLSIGYPGSADSVTDQTLEPTNKDGKVSAKRTRGSVPFYEISAANSPGMSGGPTVDLHGRVVGLVSFGPAEESQAFNFIAPSSMIQEMLGRNGVKNELGRTDNTFRQGLDHYYKGDLDKAIESFDAVLAIVPSHQQAQEFKQRAAERQATEGYGGSGSGSILLIGGLVVALAIAATAVVLTRRKTSGGGGGGKAVSGTWGEGGTRVPPVGLQPATPASPATADAEPSTNGSSPDHDHSGAGHPAPQPEPSHQSEAGAARTATAVAAKPAFCTSCGAARRPSDEFCARCGSPQS